MKEYHISDKDVPLLLNAGQLNTDLKVSLNNAFGFLSPTELGNISINAPSIGEAEITIDIDEDGGIFTRQDFLDALGKVAKSEK